MVPARIADETLPGKPVEKRGGVGRQTLSGISSRYARFCL